MKKLVFSRSAKIGYAAAAGLFVVAIILSFTGSDDAGRHFGQAAFVLAYTTAAASGHLTTRKPNPPQTTSDAHNP